MKYIYTHDYKPMYRYTYWLNQCDKTWTKRNDKFILNKDDYYVDIFPGVNMYICLYKFYYVVIANFRVLLMGTGHSIYVSLY